MAGNHEFLQRVTSPRFCERLFAHLPNVVFCLKDADRRYQAVNSAFTMRLAVKDPKQLLGMTAEDVFPAQLAEVYREQDEHVLQTGAEMLDRLELNTHANGSLGWYLATKVPLHDANGKVIGLASISRDLESPSQEDMAYAGLDRVVRHIQANLDEELQPEGLSQIAGLTVGQLDRRMRRVFQLSTAGFVRKTRLEHAAHLLRNTRQPIADIALACGYSEQSSFTRLFRATVGFPPAAYRERSRIHD